MSAAALPIAPPADCFHCGLPIPPGEPAGAQVMGAWRAMCCPGCAAVAEAIVAQGLEAYYRQRDTPGTRAEDVSGALPAELFDDPALQADFVRRDPAGSWAEATLSLEGVRCAACAWLIERRLRAVPGVVSADVGLASHRALVRFDPDAVVVSALLHAVREIGYVAHPYEPDREEAMRRREQRAALVRLGVSGLGTMQVMMYAVGLYAGALEGMSEPYRVLLRWVSLLVATVVVTVGARPFFEAAARDLRARQLGMDVPVALAIGLAYLASAVATFSGTGEVYFESVCMFTFLLSLGRFLEQRVRDASDERVRALARRSPATARLVDRAGEHVVPVRALRPGDHVAVGQGETIPLDGIVRSGASSVREDLWTGEAAPRRKAEGDRVIGGSINIESPLRVEVLHVAGEGTLASIRAMLDRAQLEKPPVARAADRVARVFVSAVLLVAAGTALFWWQHAPADALWVTLSVLVATCPCALSLATPTALAAASGSLASAGLLVTRGHALEGLARASCFVFDKTGTLTTSDLHVGEVVSAGRADWDREHVLATAAVLERDARHPIAVAFPLGTRPCAGLVAEREAELGAGVGGRVAGRHLRLGRPEWVAEIFAANLAKEAPDTRPPAGAGSWILLGGEEGPIAWISLRARLRDDAPAALAALRDRGIETLLLSGDPCAGEVDRVAHLVGASSALADVSPDEKVEALKRLQRDGDVVAAVGDGVNDAPFLSRAQVSVAMAGGSDLARVSADAVLMDDRLGLLPAAVDRARKTRRVVRQNLAWAALYNAVVLPLAVTGQLPPYLAALGMSASSLLVVLNAARLRRPIEPAGSAT